MKKLYSYIDVFLLPLKILLVAIALMGIGDFFINANIQLFIPIRNDIVLRCCQAIKYIGGLLINLFPMIVVINGLAKRFEDSVPSTQGAVAYILFNIVTMFVNIQGLPRYAYYNMFGSYSDEITQSIGNQSIFTGLIGALIVYNIVKGCYRRSRNRFTYGTFSFIDNDTWSFIASIIFSMLAGVLTALAWPYVYLIIANINSFISSNIYSSTNMFLYGVFEKIMTLFDLQTYVHQPFWFTASGGAWIDMFGQTYNGDISVWTALLSQNSDTMTFGRFITPYYIINMFGIPGLLLGIYSVLSDKLQKKKYLIFIIVAILLSILFGISWPIEVFLAITAPALYIFHLIINSALYAILAKFSIIIGYSFQGTLTYALPGTLVSLLSVISNASFFMKMIILLGIGAGCFVLYLLFTRIYYKYLSGNFVDKREHQKLCDDFIEAVGGLANIRIVNASLNKIVVTLYDPSKLDEEYLMDIGAYRIIDTRFGTEMEFGPSSTMMYRDINKKVKAYKNSLPTTTTA